MELSPLFSLCLYVLISVVAREVTIHHKGTKTPRMNTMEFPSVVSSWLRVFVVVLSVTIREKATHHKGAEAQRKISRISRKSGAMPQSRRCLLALTGRRLCDT